MPYKVETIYFKLTIFSILNLSSLLTLHYQILHACWQLYNTFRDDRFFHIFKIKKTALAEYRKNTLYIYMVLDFETSRFSLWRVIFERTEICRFSNHSTYRNVWILDEIDYTIYRSRLWNREFGETIYICVCVCVCVCVWSVRLYIYIYIYMSV